MHLKASRKAFKVALIYVIVAGAWVLFSGELVKVLISNPDERIYAFIIKGLGLVILTGAWVNHLLNRSLRQWEQESEQREKTEAARHEAEHRFQSLFENMLNGFAYCRMIQEPGKPKDFVYLAVNRAFESLTGLKNVTGKRISEVVPGIQQADAELLDIYGRVADTGVPEQFERYVEALHNWYAISVYCPAPEHFVVVFDVVTARKQAEAGLRESERLLHTVMDLVPHFIFAKDSQGRHLFVNRACGTANGLTPEQMVGRTDLEIVPDRAQAEAFMKDDREVIAGGEPKFIAEERLTNADGQTRILQTIKIPFASPGEDGPALVGVAVDITDLKRAEEALRLHKDILEETGQIAKVGGWSFDANTGAGFWTDEVARIHDLDPALPITKETGLKYFVGESRTKIEAAVKQSVEQGIPYDLELEIVSAKGIHKWVRTIGHPVTENGRVVRVHGSFQDITDLKQAEAAQQESEARFRNLYNNAVVGFYRTTPDGQILMANPALLNLLGFSSLNELAQRNLEEEGFESGNSRATFKERLERDGQITAWETAWKRRDGSVRFVSENCRVLRDESGRSLFYDGSIEDITARKQAEAALRESEARFQQMATSIEDVLYGVDGQSGEFQYVNPAFGRMLGYTLDDVTRMGGRKKFLASVIQESQFEKQSGAFDSMQQPSAHIPTPWQAWWRCRDGSLKFVEDRWIPVYSGGRLQSTYGVLRDVTHRKQAEEALQQSESQLRSITDTTKDVIFVKDRECRFVFMNPAGYQLNGKTPEQVIGHSKAEIYSTPATVAQFETDDRRVMESGQAETIEEEVIAADGARHIFLTTKVPRRDDQGNVIGLTAVAHDITARKRAEQALSESERRVRTILEQAPMAINISRDGVGLYANHKFQEIFGLQKVEEWVGRAITDYFAPQSRAESLERTRLRSLGLPAPKEFESIGLRADGSQFPMQITVASVQLSDGTANMAFVSDITERKRAEERLELLKHSIDLHYDGAYWMDTDNKFIYVNEAGCKALGYDRGELIGQSVKIVNPNVKDEILINVWQSLRERGFYTAESSHRRKDGSRFSVEISATYVRFGGKEYNCGFARDITGRKQAEELLRASEEQFRAMFELASIGMAQADPRTGQFLRVNQKMSEITGYTPEELLRMNFRDLTHQEDKQRDWEAFQQVIRGEQPNYRIEKRYVRKDGAIAWVSVNSTIIRDGAGRPIRSMATIEDITERKRAGEAHDRLATAVEQAAEVIVITDTHGTILYANPAFEKTTGYTRAEALGLNPRMLKSGKHDAEFYRRMWEVLGRGDIWSGHLINRRKDGTFFEEEATISPMRDGAGKTVNYVAVKRDVTREVQLETQFRQAQKMEAVGQLAGGVAHDFNNILAVIQLEAGLLKAEKELTQAQQKGFATAIEEAAQRAANLTRQLLLFSRQQSLQPRDLVINDVITHIAKMLQRILGENVQMLFKFSPQPLMVHADNGMMDQILLNLTVNARDAMPNGGKLIIETTAVEFDEVTAAQHAPCRPGSFVCVSVTDTGCGIPAEIRARIFEPFFTTKDVGKGSGLGLATVFGIVQQHQGWVNVYSEVGQGTTFRFYLPRLGKLSDKKVVWASLTAIKGGNETILLVEDDNSVRNSMRNTLVRLGYRVLEAYNGAEALKIWKEQASDIRLLLTDMMMPGGMSGKDVATVLLQQHPGLKVIYCSGYSADIGGQEFPLEEGVNFLAKPFESHKLAQTVRNCLDK